MQLIPPSEKPGAGWSWSGSTINRKIGIVFMVLLLVGVANVVVVRDMLRHLNGMAETMNVAGKLRMLSQKIAFETATALQNQGEQANAAASLQDAEAGFAVLRRGGSAFGYDIQPLPPLILPLLETMHRSWEQYRRHIEPVLGGFSGVTGPAGRISQVSESATRMLGDAEVLVGALTMEAQRAQHRALIKIYALFLLDASVLVVFFLIVRRQITDPIRELARQSRKLADGNYHARIDYQSHDEIGQLAEAFNRSAQEIGNMIALIEQDRQNLQQAEAMFRGLAENSVVGVYVAQDNMFRFVNPKMADMFGYEKSEMIASVGAFDLVPESDLNLVQENILKRLNNEIQDVHYERRAQRKDGATFDIEVFGSRMQLDGKTATIGVMLDITERRRVDRALRVLIACNQALVRATEESALLLEICRIVQRMSGYPFVWVGYVDNGAEKKVVPAALAEAEENTLFSMIDHVSWDESKTGKGPTGVAIRTGQTIKVHDIQTSKLYEAWRKFMTDHAILSAMSLPLRPGNKTIGALTLYSKEAGAFTPDEVKIIEELADNLAYGISALRAEAARRDYARQLEHNANHDVLTGLANRNLLSDRLKQAIAMARRSGRMVAVLLLDLDNFKVINDSQGHATGDALLQSVANRLRSSVRQTDTVARLGGDEFVIVMPDLPVVEDAAIVASKILDVLSQPFVIASQEMYISASIGLSLYPQDGADEEILLKNVDLAMYRVKQKGRAGFYFYTEEMNVRNQERHDLQIDLRYALSRGELALHYQPKVDLHTRRIIGMEALVRWMHPVKGLISPATFIPFAEETGLIVPIGSWVLQAACRQNMALQNAGFPAIGVAVNLSARQFRHPDLVGLVRQVLEETGLEPHYLELELTESILMQETEEAVATLSQLKALGVQLSLDDFGTGYSSLSYLKRFPLDNLKIDRSFVKGITSDSHDAIIIKAVIALAHNLDLKVIAEGVETKEELEFLAGYQCDEIQGYYISRPLLPEQFQSLLAGRAAHEGEKVHAS